MLRRKAEGLVRGYVKEGSKDTIIINLHPININDFICLDPILSD